LGIFCRNVDFFNLSQNLNNFWVKFSIKILNFLLWNSLHYNFITLPLKSSTFPQIENDWFITNFYFAFENSAR
jgi:hypothetical protein